MAAGIMGAPDPQDTPLPAMPPIQGAPAPLAASPSQPATPGQGQPNPLSPTPQGGIAQGNGGKGEIPTPDVQLKFKPDKLQKAQTTLDVLNAATADSRKSYMDWWEKQHGDIDDRYDHLKSQLGARPSDDEPQTKKEKFAALLEFGLHLMKNSAPASTNQGAVLASTLSDEHDANAKQQQANITAKQGAYDTQANAIETAREKEQAGIGTPAAAMKASSDQAKGDAGAVKDQASALKSITDAESTKASSLGPATYIQDPKGGLHYAVRDADGKTHTEPLLGIDGKPMMGKVLGREAGSGIDKSNQDTASMRNHKYLTGVLGLDNKTAEAIAFKEKTGNPDADHLSVYKTVMAATFGDAAKAQRVADQYTLDKYGAGALGRQNASIGAGAPPPEALKGLKHGEMLDFGPKGKWTIGLDGKPVRVGGGPQSLQ
jgi:hypothetical protein